LIWMEKTNLCLKCINWDRRPEGAPGEGMGYCIARNKIVGPHYECEYFQLRTADRVASMKRKIYGEIDEEMDEFGF
jgi:hypothetical protein